MGTFLIIIPLIQEITVSKPHCQVDQYFFERDLKKNSIDQLCKVMLGFCPKPMLRPPAAGQHHQVHPVIVGTNSMTTLRKCNQCNSLKIPLPWSRQGTITTDFLNDWFGTKFSLRVQCHKVLLFQRGGDSRNSIDHPHGQPKRDEFFAKRPV